MPTPLLRMPRAAIAFLAVALFAGCGDGSTGGAERHLGVDAYPNRTPRALCFDIDNTPMCVTPIATPTPTP